jgi:hypothetical protein
MQLADWQLAYIKHRKIVVQPGQDLVAQFPWLFRNTHAMLFQAGYAAGMAAQEAEIVSLAKIQQRTEENFMRTAKAWEEAKNQAEIAVRREQELQRAYDNVVIVCQAEIDVLRRLLSEAEAEVHRLKQCSIERTD